MVKELRNRARDVLLTQAIASEETIESAEPAEDLLAARRHGRRTSPANSRGAASSRARTSPTRRSTTWRDIRGLDPQRAGELIMAAREHWFEQGQQA